MFLNIFRVYTLSPSGDGGGGGPLSLKALLQGGFLKHEDGESETMTCVSMWLRGAPWRTCVPAWPQGTDLAPLSEGHFFRTPSDLLGPFCPKHLFFWSSEPLLLSF